ncbi:FecCD family ABC transporter permease [Knoellia subterranea]|uniref:Enterobactin ABC transporter permease n=1 Tax=Knoellia subterranea KCTC 19937 TaxID=1385521 RepID=A0A0A0JK62_9MICO|nr:iron ABC transporter permease [Knoellia subterranea]KGN37154.1 enterobactin ABC transporter permease [Knoellia subterranea KCTC 19937]
MIQPPETQPRAVERGERAADAPADTAGSLLSTGSGADASATIREIRAVRRTVRRRRLVLTVVLGLLVVGLFLARALLGDYRISFVDGIRMISGTTIPGASFIFMESTLPRACMAVLAGAAFASAGAAFQSMLRNPLASPDVLGINLGASAAAVFAVVLLGWSGMPVTLVAFAGAVAVAVTIHAFAGRGGAATGRMILVGVGLAAVLSSVVHWLLLRADIYRAQDALVWLTGSLGTVTWGEIARLGAVVLVGLPLLTVVTRQLGVLSLGDDLATGLGVRAHRLRLVITAIVVLLTASATAVCGPIAFVGFLSGPIARRLTHGRTSIPTAALVGAAMVLAADYVSAYAVPGTAFPVGVVTGLAGAPVLVWLLVAGRRSIAEKG